MNSILKFDIQGDLWLNSLKLAQNTIILTVIILISHYLLFSVTVFASELDKPAENSPIIVEKDNYTQFLYNTLPENNEKELKVAWSGYYTVTAYTSDPLQCDSTPCVTANGYNVCSRGVEDTIAANFLKFGTKVRIPEYFGDRVFVVRDRMNKRYNNRVDVWMIDKGEAKNFGIKAAKIEVLYY